MDTDMTQLQLLLDHLTQPAFCVKEGTVVFCNAAAAASVQTGADARECFSDTDAVIPFGDCELVLPQQEDCRAQTDALFFASQAMRTPLSSLFAAASNLFPRLEELEDPALQKSMAAFNRNFYQLLRLSCNLVDLRSVLSGQMQPDTEKTEMTGFVSALCERTAPLLRLCGLQLVCEVPKKLFTAFVDRQMIERALLNLISNAAKFTEPGGTVAVALEKSGARLTVKVSDDGEGVEPELLPTVYARFNRPVELDDPRWGFGAGLTLVRHIARLHGGNLLLQASPEKGTTACMMLSLRQKEETTFRSPIRRPDYTGGFSHELTELADVLPASAFETCDVN